MKSIYFDKDGWCFSSQLSEAIDEYTTDDLREKVGAVEYGPEGEKAHVDNTLHAVVNALEAEGLGVIDLTTYVKRADEDASPTRGLVDEED